MTQTKKTYLAVIAVVVGGGNFFWALAESQVLGGDALGGYARDGHYFLGSHGRYTEVSQALWTWSAIHMASMIVLFLAAFGSMFWLLVHYAFPAMMAGRTTPDVARRRADWIRASGDPMWTARVSGRVGQLRLSGPLLEVTVYPGGIVLKPVFMSEQAILAREITAVTPAGGIFGRRIEVQHTGTDGASPLGVLAGDDDPLVVAIRWIAEHPPEPSPDGPPEAPTTSEFTSGVLAAGRWSRWGLSPVAMAGIPGPAGVIFTVFSLIVSVGLIAYGIFWLIPNLGAFGIVWTGICVVILVSNLRRMVVRRP